MAFSKDGKSLASVAKYSHSSNDYEIRVWKEGDGSKGRFVFVNPADEKTRLEQFSTLYKEQDKKNREAEQEEFEKQELAFAEEMRSQYGANPKGFAQKVLVTNPKLFTGPHVRSLGNLKGFIPKHQAGTKEDAIQALAMLTPGSTPQFISHNEGVSALFGLRCNPALWKAVFGNPANLREVKGQFTKHHWIIRCSDGDLLCIGDILGNQLLALDVVFKD